MLLQLGLYSYYVVPTWSLKGLPGPNMAPTRSWSIHGPYLVHTWSICGPFVVPTSSLPGLAWSSHGSYVSPLWTYMVYMVQTRSLPRPGPYLVPKWSLPDLSSPNMVPLCSFSCPYVVPQGPYIVCVVPTWSAWSQHGLHGPYMVYVIPTRSLPGPGLPGPYLVHTWSLPEPTWSLPGCW